MILGSNSDLAQVEPGVKVLKDLKVLKELKVLSAHRAPHQLRKYLKEIKKEEVGVIIACAGGAAALPGVVASYVDIPVIGVPMESRAFKGIDSLLSILQMPRGIPVGTMAVGKSGMINAAIFAIKILSLEEKSLIKRFNRYRKKVLKF